MENWCDELIRRRIELYRSLLQSYANRSGASGSTLGETEGVCSIDFFLHAPQQSVCIPMRCFVQAFCIPDPTWEMGAKRIVVHVKVLLSAQSVPPQKQRYDARTGTTAELAGLESGSALDLLRVSYISTFLAIIPLGSSRGVARCFE